MLTADATTTVWYQCSRCALVMSEVRGVCTSCGSIRSQRIIGADIAVKFINSSGYGPANPRARIRRENAEERGGSSSSNDEPSPFNYSHDTTESEPEEDDEEEEEEEREDEDEDEDDEEQLPERPKAPRVDVHHLYGIAAEEEERIKLGEEVFDDVLSDGAPIHQCYMLAAMPGTGKSTLFRQCAASCTQLGYKVMYASGEESLSKAKLEFKRTGLFKKFPKAKTKRLTIVCTNNPDAIIRAALENKVDVLFVDSISTMSSLNCEGEMGKEKQVKYSAYHFSQVAHAENEYKGCQPMTVFMVCHATKAGGMAGPNAAKHWVDGAFMMEHIDKDTLQVSDNQDEATGYVRIRVHGKYRGGNSTKKGYYRMLKTGLRPYKPPVMLLTASKKLKGAIARLKPKLTKNVRRTRSN